MRDSITSRSGRKSRKSGISIALVLPYIHPLRLSPTDDFERYHICWGIVSYCIWPERWLRVNRPVKVNLRDYVWAIRLAWVMWAESTTVRALTLNHHHIPHLEFGC